MSRKLAVKLLREAYLEKDSCKLVRYNFLTGESLPFDLKIMADHYHAIQKKPINEPGYLIRKNDKEDGAPPLLIAIYLDNIRSAHNVGSIIRTTEAFALGTLYFAGMTPTPENKKTKDTAMGTDEWVTWHPAPPLETLPRPFIALETSEDACSIDDFIFPETFTLILGNEEYGCSDASLTAADYLVEIPLRGRKNSLNVANAFAIAAQTITTSLTNKLS